MIDALKMWQRPYTPEERKELRDHCMVWPETFEHTERLRYDATLTQAEARIAGLERDAERLNQMIRETGQGQGAIDAYVAQCEEMDALREEIARLKAVACEWEPYGPTKRPWVGAICDWIDKKHALTIYAGTISQDEAGRLAATLAHFARTGELPK